MVALVYVAVAATTMAGALAAPAVGSRSTHVIPPEDDKPDFSFGGENLVRRQDYNQNYKTGGNVNFQPTSNGYSVSFSGAGDFVVGKGWRTGTSRNISFSGETTASSGTVLVSIYGWTRNPLIEYYVQEYTSNGKGSAAGQKVGSLESDGSTYEIWKHQQVNQPSIAGTTTFWQYISNRVNKRPGSGTVTMANHFAAWQKAGLNLGSHDYQVLATEGWGNAGGSSKYTLSTAAGPAAPPANPPANPAPSPKPSTPPPKPSTTTSKPAPPPSPKPTTTSAPAPPPKPTTTSTTAAPPKPTTSSTSTSAAAPKPTTSSTSSSTAAATTSTSAATSSSSAATTSSATSTSAATSTSSTASATKTPA